MLLFCNIFDACRYDPGIVSISEGLSGLEVSQVDLLMYPWRIFKRSRCSDFDSDKGDGVRPLKNAPGGLWWH